MERIVASDVVWVLIATALVMMMTPLLAFFYGGLVRKKNVLSVLMQSMVILCLISVQWILYGYSISFGPDRAGIIGGLEWIGLAGVGLEPHDTYFPTVPHQLFMAFQMMFAVITPALIIGAFAERIKFSGFVVFVLLWATFVYDPLAHWVWAKGGWLASMGALDFAGGTVIHINAGIAALVMVLLIGKRHGGERHYAPHNLPFAVLGAGMLWFGWFGFNAGSAGSAGGLAVSAFINTNTAAAAAGVTWMMLDWITNKVPTMLGRRHGPRRGAGRGNAGLGLRDAAGRPGDRGPGKRRLLLLRHESQGEVRIRRLPRRVRGPWRRRHRRSPRDGTFRDQGHQPRGKRRPFLRQRPPALGPVRHHLRGRRFLGDYDLHHLQVGRQDHRDAR